MRMARAFSLIEVVVLLGLVGLAGSIAMPRLQKATEFLRYRMAMQELASTIRLMRFRAVNAQRTLTMRIDAATRRLQLVAVDPAPARETSVERTLWLPQGLDITQAPERLTVLPTGEMLPTAIIVEAPAFQRRFRLTTTPAGIVQLHEEPST